MVVRDYLGKELKEGDSVLFINDGSYQKGEVLTLYRNITHVVGDKGLTYYEKQQVTPETKENEIDSPYLRNIIHAYVGWDDNYETDHYGKEIENTFRYRYAKDIPAHKLIKID